MATRMSWIAAAVFALAGAAVADESWPSRPVKLVVPFAAGGNTDVVARVTGNFMQNALPGSAIVIENRAGGGGIAGTQAVASAPPDGYTLCICSIGSISISPATVKLPYDPEKDLRAISMINTNALALIVRPDLAAS